MEKVIYLVLAFAFAGINAIPVDEASGRIANGVPAGDRAYPYVVSIQWATAANLQLQTRGHICGGVMITLQHLLTAGSCTYTWGAGNTIVPIEANQYRAFAGASLLTNDTVPARIRQIVNYTLHPEHLPAPAHLNDIAVMTLVSAFDATVVTPLALPNRNTAPSDNSVCTVAGWGAPQYSTNTPSTQLLYMTKYIYNQDLCISVYNPLQGYPNIFSSMVCAATYNIISSGCFGDEGNALVCGNTLTGISFLTGNCEITAYPELYTRVSNYTDWIRSVTGSASTFKPGFFTLSLFAVMHAVFRKIVA
ncbi:trypsin beta [Amyelois transitella]|uniref:trypsin beta n=1 Tax=Amyelois transitella TaxID=680683 RepID=UPI0029902F71|nr:trypsin beta [Amyelois transitella]